MCILQLLLAVKLQYKYRSLNRVKEDCTVPKSRAAVDYTLTGIEPHGPSRSVRPIVAPANRSQSYRN